MRKYTFVKIRERGEANPYLSCLLNKEVFKYASHLKCNVNYGNEAHPCCLNRVRLKKPEPI